MTWFCKRVLYGKMVGGYRLGFVLRFWMAANGSGMAWMPDHSTFGKFAKTRRLLFLRENGFLKNDVFIVLKRQTAKTEMTARTSRRYHVFIKISLCDGICQSMSCFSWKPGFSFSVRLIHFISESCSGSRVPRQKALISNRRTIIPEAPGVA